MIIFTTSADNPGPRIQNGILLSNNSENLFSDKTSFYVTTTEAANITLEVFSVLGMKITHDATFVNTGTHRFLFEGGALDSIRYFLTARRGLSHTITKMLKIDGGGNASLQLVYEGLVSGGTESSNGFRKARGIDDDYRFAGYTNGFVPDAVFAIPKHDTTYRFQWWTTNTLPKTASFVADSYGNLTGDTVHDTDDAEGNLSKAWYDFNGNGTFDDSVSVLVGSEFVNFKAAFKTSENFTTKDRAMDGQGLFRALPEELNFQHVLHDSTFHNNIGAWQ